ncbi:MAG: hypothetical protein ABJQ14_01180, partial [Hyphomicrobiales bacterium]
ASRSAYNEAQIKSREYHTPSFLSLFRLKYFVNTCYEYRFMVEGHDKADSNKLGSHRVVWPHGRIASKSRGRLFPNAYEVL